MRLPGARVEAPRSVRPTRRWRPFVGLTGWTSTFWYTVATVLMTWPLARGLDRDIPWDLGDSVLNCWILEWDLDHLLGFVSGHVGALAGYWNGNIFHPEPLALAYSEHLTAQAVQVLPLFAATHNVILCYNVLFLSTFVLSGLGTFLLVRELTGNRRAALVAGLIYAFAPYRIGQFSHLQVLSSQWMPFALYGLRRYFETRSMAALGGAAAAIVLENLSCGYFLVYFPPFVAAYVLYEVVTRRQLSDWRMWIALGLSGIASLACTWPFVTPYLELRERGFPPRPLAEVEHFSADVFSYLTAHGAQRMWGSLVRAFPKPEGDLFPSVVPVALALSGVLLHGLGAWKASRRHRARDSGASFEADRPARLEPTWMRAVAVLIAAVLTWYIALAVVILATGGIATSVGGLPIRIVNLSRALRVAAGAWLVLVWISPRARTFFTGSSRSGLAFYVLATAMAFWLSLGPTLRSMGGPILGGDIYGLLYEHVPGFDGLRVPARYGMLVMLFLSVVAGFGAAASERQWPRLRRWTVAIGVLFLIEATSAPIELNGVSPLRELRSPAPRLLMGSQRPAVYRFLATLPTGSVIVEFPFGEDQYELRYMFYSAEHWKPLINGYSGGFPTSYVRSRAALGAVTTEPARAWEFLARTTATHAVVHEALFLEGDGERVSSWLETHGARRIASFGTDRVYALR